MADCSYSRCVQERRNIRRELQKWTKNMVYIVGLERIAEELMGRRKWKLYQECMSRNQQQPSSQVHSHPHPITNNINNNNNNCIIDSDSKVSSTTTQATQTTATTTTTTTTTTITTVKQEPENDEQERLKDWSPQSKCYFCVDGKLDSDHTTHGALSPRPSDSESSDSPSDSEVSPTLLNKSKQHQQYQLQQQQQLQSLGRHRSGGMTTIESVTSMASLAAVAALTGGTAVGSPGAAQVPFAYQPLFASAPWYLNSLARNLHQHQQQQQQQQQQHERSMDVDKVGGEQPLDLSSKPGNSTTSTSTTPNSHSAATTPTPIIDNKIPPNLRLAPLDTKHIFKAKPRMSAVGGRRTYTEEELQAALRDIQSGKLGTRRAAVIYGIPRSTLRNKVYKLAMERERETHLVPPGPLGALVAEDDAMDDDKELSGAEEEKEVEKALQAPLLTMADFVRFSNIAESPDALRALLLQQHQLRSKEGAAGDMWAGMEHSALGPYIQLMMANQLAVGGAKEADFILPEIMRKIIAEEQHLNNGETKGPAAAAATASHPHPSPSNSIKTERLKTDSMSDMDTDDSPSNVILKIPSFKPTTSKNGGDMYRGDTGALASPPVTSESGSPPIVAAGNMLSIREAIAKSISQKFQQSPEPLKMHADIDYKRAGMTPPLAIIKNHQVPSEPPTPPASVPTIPQPPTIVHTRNYQAAHNNALAKQPNNNNSNQNNNNNNNNNSSSNNNSAGGKGTRPKRGKYRNYDRDSLVEAVRAVQRGEMSVHRAGSYYGVPHSTLEYKVKERHLMRPRKRDPKPNPVDEKIASIKSQEIRNIPDKLKPAIKPQQKFAPTSPNGMKMPPIFDPAMAPMGYNPPPFPFWPHPSFPHLPLDYPRNPSTSQFPPNPEFFASQMMQRLQEQSARCHPETAGGGGLTSANGNTSTTAVVAPPATPPAALAKMAESLYDGTGANGSFLDGIIRSSLESGVPPASGDKEDNKNVAPENMSNKALLDQLCRNSRITPLPKANSVNTEPSSSGDESYRKGTSPLNFNTKTTMEHDNGKCRDRDRDRDDIQTIELSNDSNDSTSVKDDVSAPSPTQQSPPSRIYVKPQFQEITKPENLKPEVLVRFRATADECDDSEPILIERNGIVADAVTGSASDKPDMAQD